MRNLRNSKGFTLIELMIVVVIIGILAAIAIPKFNNATAMAKEKEADLVLKNLYTMQNTYFAQWGAVRGQRWRSCRRSAGRTRTRSRATPTSTTRRSPSFDATADVCLALKGAATGYSPRSINTATGVIQDC